MARSKIRVEMNSKGVGQLLKSDEVRRDLERRAAAIAQAAGPGHILDTNMGPNRVEVEVVTRTFEARANEARNRSLSRAIGAGR